MSQQNLGLKSKATASVECLGQTFPNEEARREHFLKLLAAKLKDPEFRKIEGFPIGKDEDILALSDPPYYTACPNPWIGDFLKAYGTAYDPKKPYHCEPFAADVSEGKNHPIYNAHSYHTKVPHRAIMRYILHYTAPGEIVLDGFAGSGMTGVAAQACAKPDSDFKAELEAEAKRFGSAPPRWGSRRCVLSDLSPSATFISSRYSATFSPDEFAEESAAILRDFEKECGWMYETRDPKSGRSGRIGFTVWAELFTCPQCTGNINYYEVAVAAATFHVESEFQCPHCNAALDKKSLDRRWVTDVDPGTGSQHRLVRYEPVLINYELDGKKLEKKPQPADIALLEKIERSPLPDWFPTEEMPQGERRGKDGYHLKGISHVHQFYFRRALLAYSQLWKLAAAKSPFTRFYVQGSCLGFTKMNRYSANHFSQTNRYFSGTLFVGSLISEVSPRYCMTHKRKRLVGLSLPGRDGNVVTTTQSTTSLSNIPGDSVDYIFIDPPFGNNLHYSELNFFWESWLKVWTKREPEAVMDIERQRSLQDYQRLMTEAFNELFRILKPGRWMTVEFHNSRNAVWNSIQLGLQEAGFIVADVRTLDKQQETYKQSIQKLVKQDLVISAYKPDVSLEQRFGLHAGTEAGVWDFVETHLKQLPVFCVREECAQIISERQRHLLYDRMVAFHIVRSVSIPMTAGEFFEGLTQRYPERDSMYFLAEQVNEYDRKRLSVPATEQLELFIDGEATAIRWVRIRLLQKPRLFRELQPEFMQEVAGWKKHEKTLELLQILQDNFLPYEGEGQVPSQIHSYLSTQFKELRNLSKDDPELRTKAKGRWYVPDPKKNIDVERVRTHKLLEEFWTYLPEGYTPAAISSIRGEGLPGLAAPIPKIPKGKKLKELRTEAVRVGFKHCYQAKDYQTILVVGQMLPDNVLNEDEQLQMIHDTAVTRTSGD